MRRSRPSKNCREESRPGVSVSGGRESERVTWRLELCICGQTGGETQGIDLGAVAIFKEDQRGAEGAGAV